MVLPRDRLVGECCVHNIFVTRTFILSVRNCNSQELVKQIARNVAAATVQRVNKHHILFKVCCRPIFVYGGSTNSFILCFVHNKQ